MSRTRTIVYVLVGASRVARSAVPEVGVPHQLETLQEIEGPIDGRDVHGRGAALHVGADLPRGGAAQLPDSVEHELALRRHPQAVLAQRPLQGGVHGVIVGPMCSCLYVAPYAWSDSTTTNSWSFSIGFFLRSFQSERYRPRDQE